MNFYADQSHCQGSLNWWSIQFYVRDQCTRYIPEKFLHTNEDDAYHEEREIIQEGNHNLKPKRKIKRLFERHVMNCVLFPRYFNLFDMQMSVNMSANL